MWGKEGLLAYGKSMATVTHLTFIGFIIDLMENERKKGWVQQFYSQTNKKATQPGLLTLAAVFWLLVALVPLPCEDDYVWD